MKSDIVIGRFAPSTTGPAHPGTLLAALLCWLDIRSRGGRVILRLEDLDPERCQPDFATAMINDLQWFGLSWDVIEKQSQQIERYSTILDKLADCGLLYPSHMTRKNLEIIGRKTPDGGWAYDNSERGTPLPTTGWRTCSDPLRVQLPDDEFAPHDRGGRVLTQIPTQAFGDPIVRRRDGAFAYHLVAVVDDAVSGVTDIVRGHDIASSTATQMALQQILGYRTPRYRHHFLLLEQRDKKLAKLHGSVGAAQLQQHYSATELCGFLAHISGLRSTAEPCSPDLLRADFSWSKVRFDDVVVNWTGSKLEVIHE